MGSPPFLRRIADDPWLGALAVLLVAMTVYLPRLGADGLAGTEGHRVIPGWELLDRLEGDGGSSAGGMGVSPVRAADGSRSEQTRAAPELAGGPGLIAPTMFDRLYLRKPPGMMWAEAASAAAFGRTEWSARFVGAASSIGLAMMCWGFGWRWFGARGGLAAGIALALTPWLWQSGRSAEIEPLHNLWVAVAAFCAIELLVNHGEANGSTRRHLLRTALVCAGLALGVTGAAAAKGPAGAPVLGGAILAGLLVMLRDRHVREGLGRALAARGVVLVLALAAAGAAIVPVWLEMQRAGAAPGADAAAQGASEFLWDGPALKVLALPLAALVAALPLSLALPQAWARGGWGGIASGRGSSPEAGQVRTGETPMPPSPTRGPTASPGRWGYPVARTLGWATIIAIAIYTLIGISNVRYVMPVAPLMAPLVGWAVVNGIGSPRRSLAGVFDRLITRCWWVWAGGVLVGSQVYVWGVEPSRDGRSGREAGLALGASLPAGAEVWANDLIEAVPETLLYAQRAGGLRVRWRDVTPGQVPSGVHIALRSDADSGEADAWRRTGLRPAPVFEGAVRHYRFVVIEAP